MTAELVSGSKQSPDPASASRFWWISVALSRKRLLLARRSSLSRDLGPALALSFVVVCLFMLLSRSATRAPGGGAGLNILLFLFQFCVLAASIRGLGGRSLFSEPEGPLLPFTAGQLAVIWAGRLMWGIAAPLGLAYFGIMLGSRHTLGWKAAFLALVADSAGFTGALLLFGVVRWAAGTYLPIEARRVWAFLRGVVFRSLGILLVFISFSVAVRFAVSGVFVSRAAERTLVSAARFLESQPSTLADPAQVLDPVHELRGGHASAMSSLLIEGGGTPLLMGLLGRLGMLLAVTALLLLPGRRREQPRPLRLFGTWLRDRTSDACAAIVPARWKSAARLTLPFLPETGYFPIVSSTILFATSLSIAWSHALEEAGRPPHLLPSLAIMIFGSTVAAVSVASLVPATSKIGLTDESFVRLSAMPLPYVDVALRILSLVLCVVAVEDLAVAATWARLLGRSGREAALFGVGLVSLAVVALVGAILWRALLWRNPARVRDGVETCWFLLCGAAALGHFLLVSRYSHLLMPALGVEVFLALAVMLILPQGIAAMVASREPSAEM